MLQSRLNGTFSVLALGNSRGKPVTGPFLHRRRNIYDLHDFYHLPAGSVEQVSVSSSSKM